MALQVCQSVAPQMAPGLAFRNTWVQQLRLQLPVLAMAIDDALVALVERLQQLMAAGAGLPCHA